MPRKIDPRQVISGSGMAGSQSVGADALLFDAAKKSSESDPAIFYLNEKITDTTGRVEVLEFQNDDTQWLRDSERAVFYQLADGGSIEWEGTVAGGGTGRLSLTAASLLITLGVTPNSAASRAPFEWWDGSGTRFPTIFRHLQVIGGSPGEVFDVKTNAFIFDQNQIKIRILEGPVAATDPEVDISPIIDPVTGYILGSLVTVTYDSGLSHTIQDVIDAINLSGGPVQAQIGVGNPILSAFAYAEAELVGGQDGVFYEISAAELATSASLNEGAVLAIQFDSIAHRKSHIEENSNGHLIPGERLISLGTGTSFVIGAEDLEAESLIPNAHIIGRVIDDKFVFSNGQYLLKEEPQTSLQPLPEAATDLVLRADLNRGLQWGAPAPGDLSKYGSHYVGLDVTHTYEVLTTAAPVGSLQVVVEEIDSLISTNVDNIALGEVYDRVYARPANGIADSDVSSGQIFKVFNNGVTGAFGPIPVMGANILWSSAGVSASSRVATDGRYVVTCNNANVTIIDLNDGTPSVTTETFDGGLLAPIQGLAVGGGWVVAMASNASSEAVISAINLATPATKWTANLGSSSGFDGNLAINPSRDRVYATVTVANITTIYQRSLTDGTSAGASVAWGESGTDFAQVRSIVPVLDKVFVGGQETESNAHIKVYGFDLTGATTVASGGDWDAVYMCTDGNQLYAGVTSNTLTDHEVHVFDITDPYTETTATLATFKLNSSAVGGELYPFYADDRYLYIHQGTELKRIDKRNVAQNTPISTLLDLLVVPDPTIRGQICSDGTFVFFITPGSGISVQVLDRKLRWYVKRDSLDGVSSQSAYLV